MSNKPVTARPDAVLYHCDFCGAHITPARFAETSLSTADEIDCEEHVRHCYGECDDCEEREEFNALARERARYDEYCLAVVTEERAQEMRKAGA
jgi:hypothetical protein